MRRLWRGLTGAIKRLLDIPVGFERKEKLLETLYHRQMPPRLDINWLALILGPVWYFLVGMWVHGSILLSIVFLSGGLLAPFVWIYAGLKANEDLLDYWIARKSVY